MRRVYHTSATGSSFSKREKTILTIQVDKVDFDPQAGQLHLNGRVCEENKYVSVGAQHTLDLELQRNFTIFKEEWDSVTLGVVKEACDPAEKSEIGAVVLQEGRRGRNTTCIIRILDTNNIGFANICFITEHMTVLRQRVEVPIPKKRGGFVANYEKVLLA